MWFQYRLQYRLKVSANFGFGFGVAPKPKLWFRQTLHIFDISILGLTICGLKWPPAFLQPLPKSPTACTWNPCLPGSKPRILPLTKTPEWKGKQINIVKGQEISEELCLVFNFSKNPMKKFFWDILTFIYSIGYLDAKITKAPSF